MSTETDTQAVIERARGRRILLPGHFTHPVRVEDGFSIDGLVVVRVRTAEGQLREITLDPDALAAALETAVPTLRPAARADEFFLFVESARIRLAFAYDPYFAVNLTGIEVLPHQLEAVYERMLPQVLLRFLLADDPGSGKTIMAGLLMKELLLRGVIERVLIVCPAALTIQWEDELLTKFDERFELMTSDRVKGTLTGNAWEAYPRCITSMDFAKRDEVREKLLEAHWDLVVVDEAHKCSARTDGDKVSKTRRYELAERLSRKVERMLLLTATPHQGDADQFGHFLKLLDEDLFIGAKQDKKLIQLEDSPWYLRRMKEDLRTFEGAKLFTPRYAITQEFELTQPEKRLYDDVTAYINDYLPRQQGRRRNSVALARIVLQRRLASSLGAITSSLQRRFDRFREILAHVEGLPPSEQAQALAKYRLIDVDIDDEQEIDDQVEEVEDELAEGTFVADRIDFLREEVTELERLVELAKETQAGGEEAKLEALKSCLERAEFEELKDGRGKLLIFTEHRDTLEYLLKHLREWGFTTTSIHGGMSPQERRQRQIEFNQERQICVATEAAGEGINLQFCHLMINYDLPWNPNRLEQRMGRIHRIGQRYAVYVFNFVAMNTIEGQILARLLWKLDEIKKALGDRVYDVIGELLKISGVNIEELLRDAAYNPQAIEDFLDQIELIDPKRLQEYEQATGIALAKSTVDLTRIRGEDWRSQERRLMPEYVEGFFMEAARLASVSIERRADGLFRIEHVPAALRSDDLETTRRFGRLAPSYRKFTFLKDIVRRQEHLDAELVSPGHRLFAAADEVLNDRLRGCRENGARFLDPLSPKPYRLHFFEAEVHGGTIDVGRTEIASATLVTLVEDESGAVELGPPDILHDLTPAKEAGEVELDFDQIEELRKIVMVRVQHPKAEEVRDERLREVGIRRKYLEESFTLSIRKARDRWMQLADRAVADENYKLARDEAERRMKEIERRRDDKLGALENLSVVLSGQVRYLGTAIVDPTDAAGPGMHRDDEVEEAAMKAVLDEERARGWEPVDVSRLNDGSGFDIRSIGPPDAEGKREVRRIEVKGRAAADLDVMLTPNEWVQAGRHRDTYWLYVVWNAKTSPTIHRIQDPAAALRDSVQELQVVRGYRVPADAIVEAAR